MIEKGTTFSIGFKVVGSLELKNWRPSSGQLGCVFCLETLEFKISHNGNKISALLRPLVDGQAWLECHVGIHEGQ